MDFKVNIAELLLTYAFFVYLLIKNDTINTSIEVIVLVVLAYSSILQACNLISVVKNYKMIIKTNSNIETLPISINSNRDNYLENFIRQSTLIKFAHLKFSTSNNKFKVIDSNNSFSEYL